MNIGHKIRAIRNEKGYSQETLAKGMGKGKGVSQNLIHKIESGKIKPTLAHLKEIAIVLETPITDLMDLGIYQENKDSPNSGVQCTYNIHHHFPPEVIEILRKLVDKL